MKPRIFSKFPAKRFREMPIHSLICIFSLFISSLHDTGVSFVMLHYALSNIITLHYILSQSYFMIFNHNHEFQF